MTIPSYKEFMLPFLKMISDGEVYTLQNIYEKLPRLMGISEEEIKKLLPSGKIKIVNNRINWARTDLKKYQLFKQPKRGQFVISQRGIDLLSQNPAMNNTEFYERLLVLDQGVLDDQMEMVSSETRTPDEVLESAYEDLNHELSQELLALIKSCSPQFFEYLVVDLLVNMGYGGSRKDAAQVVGKSGDEGIDGIIKEDRLGLDVVYVQAKKWENTIGRPEIQKFAGALQGQRAKKGVFITTSAFTKDAIGYARRIDNKIILIDGSKLAQLMIEFNVGVSIINRYEIKKMDADYFEGQF